MNTTALLPILPLLLLLTAVCPGEDIYVSQGGGGSGASSASPLAISWLATAGNWGSGAGKVGPGDTVHLCGTITSTVTVLGSGNVGSPITIRFEPGAMLSKPAWGIDGASAIYASGKSHVVIDGNGVGIIECTNNGDALGLAQPAYGITAKSGSGWTIRDLTIRNIFVHTYNATNVVAAYSTRGVFASNISDFTVSGNTITGAYVGVYYIANGASLNNCTIEGNTLAKCSTALISALGGSATDAMSGVVIADNDIAMGLNWFDPPNNNHIDGIHTWTSPGTITGLDIHGNYIHGDPSTHCTGYVYVEGNFVSPLFYNNVMVGSTNRPAGGFFAFKLGATTTQFHVFNNTVVGLAANNTGGTGIQILAAAGTVAELKNNILTNLFVGVYGKDAPGGLFTSDYNSFFGNGMVGWLASGSYSTLASWQTVTGGDAHSLSSDPALTGAYTPSTGSPARDAGIALASYFTTDKAGLARPQGSGWDIGAYEYAGSVAFSTTASSGSESTAAVSLSVTLGEVSGQPVTVAYAVTSGTATGGGADYTLANGTLSFASGATAQNINFSVVNDSTDESDETVVVTLSGPTNATLGTNTRHTYTITDNDPTPSVSLSAPAGAIAENGGTKTVTATLSAVSGRTVTVNLAGTGTVSAGDYTADMVITIPAGSGSGTATITAVQDAVDEPDETVAISIASATNASVGGSTVTVTIVDDDPAPTFTVSRSGGSGGGCGFGGVGILLLLVTAAWRGRRRTL